MSLNLIYLHRRTVHRGLGGARPPPQFVLKLCRRAPQFFFENFADGPPSFLKNNRLLDGPLKLVTLL